MACTIQGLSRADRLPEARALFTRHKDTGTALAAVMPYNALLVALTKSGKYKTHVVKGDMMVMLGPGFPINNTFGCAEPVYHLASPKHEALAHCTHCEGPKASGTRAEACRFYDEKDITVRERRNA